MPCCLLEFSRACIEMYICPNHDLTKSYEKSVHCVKIHKIIVHRDVVFL